MFVNLLPKESMGSIFRVLILVGCLTPSVAQAGFDWTPPPAAPSAHQAAPVVQDAAPALSGPLTPEPDALPVPVGNVESAPIAHNEPLVVNNKPAPAPVAEKVEEKEIIVEAAPAPEAAPEPAPLPVPEPAPIAAKPAPTPTPVVADASPVSNPASNDVIEGFGKDIPLAIALRDIAPAKYAYSFSPRDVAGAKISWRGGKPWQDVLKDALTPYDLGMVVNDNTITIFAKQYSATGSNSAALPTPVAPPAAPSADADTADTLVANRPDNAPAPATDVAEPLPLVASQDAQAQEAAVKPASTEVRRTVSAMDMKSVRKWQARPGTTLRQTLETWAKDSNVEINWSTPYDYPISNAFYFEGEFTQAVDSLLSSYRSENPKPKGRLYPNLPEGPSVLMIN